MAGGKDLDFSYSLTDRVIRLALGELADFSGAKYDGDFSLTLEQAQRRKHEYVAEQIAIEPGRRVIDLGCGWGGLLDYFRRLGATGLGLTLSSAQLKACQRHGLDVRLADAQKCRASASARSTRPRALGRSSISAPPTTTARAARKMSTAGSSAGSRTSCPTRAGSTYRRWCSGGT